MSPPSLVPVTTFGVAGSLEYVYALTQSVLMSISIARTAPAFCSVLANDSTDIAGPPAYTSAPVAVTPTPERHTYTLLPSVAPNTVVSSSRSAGFSAPVPPVPVVPPGVTPGAAPPLSTSSSRFWRTDSMSGPIVTSRPHTPTVADPSLRTTSDAAPFTSGRTS